jgi:hypothetical protein
MSDELSERAEEIRPQPERHRTDIPAVYRHARVMERVVGPRDPTESQLIPGLPGQAQDALIDGAERIGHCPAGLRAEARDQRFARAPQLGAGAGVIEPGQPAMRRAMRGEAEAPRAPMLDRLPAQVREAAPGVPDVPGVGFAGEIRDQKRRRGEAQVGEDWIGVVRERGVAVVERQQERPWYGMRAAWVRKIRERERPPPRARQSRHLPGKHRSAHPRHPKLERTADAVIAEDRRRGQGSPPVSRNESRNSATVTSDIGAVEAAYSKYMRGRAKQTFTWYDPSSLST